MLISHEAPISIFDRVQLLTDYDYALVHLFEENENYYERFAKAKNLNREIILDNSIFELGTAFDSTKFALWIEKLQPTYYIIPDSLEDLHGTITNFDEWKKTYGNLPGKTIGVVQGRTYQEVVECYDYLVDKVDKIAISFDYSFFEDWKTMYDLNFPTKYHQWMYGRQTLLQTMLKNNKIRTDKPHHLLGCGLPQEFKDYRHYNFITSVDTSNPIVHGLKGIRYDDGLQNKESVKLFTLINETVPESAWSHIAYNISEFRKLCNG